MDFWCLLISRRATVPGRYRYGFFTPPVAGADFLAAFVASCLRGAFPPVDFRAVCLVRAMVLSMSIIGLCFVVEAGHLVCRVRKIFSDNWLCRKRPGSQIIPVPIVDIQIRFWKIQSAACTSHPPRIVIVFVHLHHHHLHMTHLLNRVLLSFGPGVHPQYLVDNIDEVPSCQTVSTECNTATN